MRRWLLIFSLMLCTLVAAAQGKCGVPVRENLAFQAGERLELGLQYKWGAVRTEVAQAVVTVDTVRYKGTPAFRSAFVVQSAPFFDVFFKMRENFRSWFTRDDIRPLKFIRETQEGNYTASNLYLYDWEERQIHATVAFGSKPETTLDIPLHDCVWDLPTVIYYLRNLDCSRMKPGAQYPLSFVIDDEVFNIHITYNGPSTLKAKKLGRFRVQGFSCSVVSGAMFEGDQQLQVWFSDDENFVPVAVMAPLRWGAVWGWLKGYEGLKYPLASLSR